MISKKTTFVNVSTKIENGFTEEQEITQRMKNIKTKSGCFTFSAISFYFDVLLFPCQCIFSKIKFFIERQSNLVYYI